MQKLASLLFTTLIGIGIVALAHETRAQTSATPSMAGAVSTNDNTRPAGRIEGDVLNVRLYAGVGSWRPEGPQGAPIEIAAFGEEGANLSIPGPSSEFAKERPSCSRCETRWGRRCGSMASAPDRAPAIWC